MTAGPAATGTRDVRVRDVMTRDVVTIEATATLTEAAQTMREANVGALPVLEGGRVAGIASLALRLPGDQRTLDAAGEVARRSARPAA
jgi:CBS domain-containing protein